MVPLWLFPIATTAGNTFLLKPSERDPGAAMMLAELAMEAGKATARSTTHTWAAASTAGLWKRVGRFVLRRPLPLCATFAPGRRGFPEQGCIQRCLSLPGSPFADATRPRGCPGLQGCPGAC